MEFKFIFPKNYFVFQSNKSNVFLFFKKINLFFQKKHFSN